MNVIGQGTYCGAGLHRWSDPGVEVITVAGRRYCRLCQAGWKRRRRHGLTDVAVGFRTKGERISAAKRAGYKRKAELGLPHLTTEGRARYAEKRKALAEARRWCRKGLHPWVPVNIENRKNGKKTCRRCRQVANQAAEARRRAKAVRQETETERDRLWAARIAAHPDAGGSVDAFVRSDKAWKRFLHQGRKRT